MKSVLLSIRPEWVAKILNGEKTVEVRKTRPQAKTPFKCYIYCTLGEELWGDGTGETWWGIAPDEDIKLMKSSCLSFEEINNYRGDKNIFAWYISDLKIYNMPKPLSKFVRKCKHYDGGCDTMSDLCKTEQNGDCHCGYIKLTRPPQSWCYVKQIGDYDNE